MRLVQSQWLRRNPRATRRSTAEPGLHSLVLALDYRVDDAAAMWSLIEQHRPQLAGLGAHHVVLYVSIREPERVLVTIGVRHRKPIQELLRSPAMFEWFDMVGVHDIPAIFAGEVVEKIDLGDCGARAEPAGVIVGAVSVVSDVAEMMTKVHGALERFREGGVRKLWVYRAFDDGQEVLTLLQVDGVQAAQNWIDHPDADAEWMWGAATMRADANDGRTQARTAAYPSLFVGTLADVMSLEARVS